MMEEDSFIFIGAKKQSGEWRWLSDNAAVSGCAPGDLIWPCLPPNSKPVCSALFKSKKIKITLILSELSCSAGMLLPVLCAKESKGSRIGGKIIPGMKIIRFIEPKS